MRTIAITDPDDPRLADYLNVRDRDLVRRETFMAEGRLVVAQLLSRASRYRARSVLVTPVALEAMRDDIERGVGDAPVYIADQGVMDAIVGFPIHRGCLAAGEVGEAVTPEALVSEVGERSRVLLVLEDIANHDNVGAIFRNAAAFGAGGVLLNERCCSPLYRKAVRVSMGASLRVAWATTGRLVDELDRLAGAGWAVVALTPDAGATDLAAFAASPAGCGRVALVLGAEGPGLSEEALGAATHRVRIPIGAGTDSLNVATAGAIALYGLSV